MASSIALAGLALLLTGCESFDKATQARDPRPCPRFATLRDAASLTRFTGTGRDLTDVDFIVAFGDIQGECVYGSDGIDMTLKVPFIAERGPANQSGQAAFDYFVAVATVANEIGGRESFTTVVPFHGSSTRNGGTEEVEQEIPLREGETGADYIVYLGFVLTEDELRYNEQAPSPSLAPPVTE